MRALHGVFEAAQFAAGQLRDGVNGTAGAILVSRTVAAAANDLSMLKFAIRRQLVLGQGNAQSPNLFRVLDDPLWLGHGRVVVGASIFAELHPLLGAAVAELCGWMAGSHRRLWVQAKGDLRRPGPAGAEATHLCRWILAQARAAVGDEPSTTLGELQQFLTSGGHRAVALERLLDAVQPDGGCDEIIEVGAGVGLISWLLAADQRRSVRQVMLVDPTWRYELAAQQLWGGFSASRDDRRAFLAKMPAYRFNFDVRADLVFLCQTVFAVPPDRRETFFVRCWDALKPGGTLIINEIVVDDADPPGETGSAGHRDALRRNEFVALLSQFAEPYLYRELFDWSRAEDPLAVPAQEYYASSFILLRRD